MTSPLIFFQQTFAELKLVVWPTRAQLFHLTFIVIIISVVVGAYIGGLDFALTKLTQELIK